MKRIIVFIIRYVYAAVACLYLFTVGFVFAKNRPLLSTICTHFGYTEKFAKPIIPKVELSEVAPENSSIQIREPIVVYGSVTLLETVVIAKLMRLYNPSKVFEIGTFDGRITLNMASNCSPEVKVYTLDLPKDELHSTKFPTLPLDKVFIDKETTGSSYLGKDCEKKIIQLYGDSATFDFSPFFNTIDFVFIDGSHAYEYVLNDSKQALKLLKNGRGVILWHDYDALEDVTRALNELYSKASGFKGLRHIKGTSLVSLIID